MGFWITVFILLFIYLVVVLILKVIEEKRVKRSREEIPGRVSSIESKKKFEIYFFSPLRECVRCSCADFDFSFFIFVFVSFLLLLAIPYWDMVTSHNDDDDDDDDAHSICMARVGGGSNRCKLCVGRSDRTTFLHGRLQNHFGRTEWIRAGESSPPFDIAAAKGCTRVSARMCDLGYGRYIGGVRQNGRNTRAMRSGRHTRE